MKAKELAKILLQNPEAEVITQEYIGDNFFVPIDYAKLHQKGSKLHNPVSSGTGAVNSQGKCIVDVIYVGRTER